MLIKMTVRPDRKGHHWFFQSCQNSGWVVRF